MLPNANPLSWVLIFCFSVKKKNQSKVATVSGTGRDDENGPRDENANRGPERHEMTIYHGQLPGEAWAWKNISVMFKKWNSTLEILKNSYFLVYHTWDIQMLISVHKLRKAHHDIPATVLVCNG